MKTKIKEDERIQEEEEEEDMISRLPDSIIHQILMMLPLKCSVRTSILSKRWRDLHRSFWAYALSLDFGKNFYHLTPTIQEFIRIVDFYLNLHKGTDLPTFRLFFHPGLAHPSQFNRWIEIAAEKRVRQLDLHFQIYSPPFKWPSCLSSSDTLTVLKLQNCTFELGIDFRGLNALRVLKFRKVNIARNVLYVLLLNCASLEELCFWGCDGLRLLEISATDLRLKSLTLVGCCGVDNALLIKALSERAQLRSITMCNVAARHLVEHGGAIRFPKLMELQLLDAVCYCKDLQCYRNCQLHLLFQFLSFACLEKLIIQLRWKCFEGMPFRCPLNNLKEVKMSGFNGNEEQMNLVKFLLANSFLLETVDLVTPKKESMESLLQQLLLLPEASPNVQFVLHHEHLGDDNSPY